MMRKLHTGCFMYETWGSLAVYIDWEKDESRKITGIRV